MKIFDCFIFFNEVELLELRFMELYNVVDYFVIVEANKTHTGKPKEFVFEKNKEIYKKYLDKIIYVKVDDAPEYSPHDIFRIEHFQRNAIMRGLTGKAAIGDKILVSDADEIPDTKAIRANLSINRWILFKQAFFYYYVNCKLNMDWGGTVMADWGTFKWPRQLRAFAKRHSWEKSGEAVYLNGGWHYSYLTGGDPDKIREKVENISESKNIIDKMGSREDIIEKVKNHQDLFSRNIWKLEQHIVDISETKPRSMDEFLKKYPQYLSHEPAQQPIKNSMDTKSTLDYVVKRFKLGDLNQEMPIMIPNTNRVSLARLFGKLGFKEGAEIGVQAGAYSKILCQKNPGVKLHCVDAWEKYPGYVDFVSPSTYITQEKEARRVLAPYNCNFIKKYSVDAVKDFPDRSLDFVYIDANHDIKHVIEDITEWSKKVKKGGIISGHDYFISLRGQSQAHVVFALQAYTKSWKISPWFVLGREEKIPGEKRDSSRSWFFVV